MILRKAGASGLGLDRSDAMEAAMPMLETAGDLPAGGAVEHLAKEMTALCQCGYDLYADYISALAQARSPEAVLIANTRFMTESFGLAARSAGLMFQGEGLRAPLLCDA